MIAEDTITDEEIDAIIYPRGKWGQKRDITDVVVKGFRVIGHHKRTTKSNQAHWLLRCETCGFEKVLNGTQIRCGSVGKCETCNPKVEKIKPVKVRRKSKLTILLERIQELESRLAAIESK
jgi:hypothetical protein